MFDRVNKNDLPGLEEGPNGSWHLYHSQTKMIFALVAALVFVGGGAWLCAMTDDSITAVIGYVAVALFGACALFATIRLSRPTPALVFDAEGLGDHASAVAAGRMTWAEIERIVPYQFSRQWMLGIYPHDLDAVLARQSALRRMAMKANMGLGAAPINVPQSALPVSVKQLAEFLSRNYGVRVEADP